MESLKDIVLANDTTALLETLFGEEHAAEISFKLHTFKMTVKEFRRLLINKLGFNLIVDDIVENTFFLYEDEGEPHCSVFFNMGLYCIKVIDDTTKLRYISYQCENCYVFIDSCQTLEKHMKSDNVEIILPDRVFNAFTKFLGKLIVA